MNQSILALSLAISASVGAAQPPLRITAAQIHTQDADQPRVEAMLVDRERGTLIAIGGAQALQTLAPQAEHLDLGAASVIPGLIDAHAHLLGLGLGLVRADLSGTSSKAEILQILREAEGDLPKGAWLLGRGWDQNDWPETEYPSAADLDQAFPERPVFLRRIDGHAGWANSAAMGKVGRDLAGDWQPEGGRILRDAESKATGVFVDTAIGLVESQIPRPSREELRLAFSRAMQASAASGLTGVHDMGISLEQFEVLRGLADADALPIRVYAHADGDAEALQALCGLGSYGKAGDMLQMRAVKYYVDGALGSRGARMLAEYSDEPGNQGIWVTGPDDFERLVRRADQCGLQIATHAIGDAANRMVLDTYARVEGAALPAARWRIEHAQIIAPVDLPRFAKLGVIASMQPTHATSDMPWAELRVGESRLQGAYAWNTLLGHGARLAFGSDFPVEAVSPMLGLYAAISRQDLAGGPEGGWLATERVNMAQAIAGFTTGAAYASFEEDRLGKLSPGFAADFVVFDTDPTAAAPRDLAELPVAQTWVAGRLVFSRAEEH